MLNLNVMPATRGARWICTTPHAAWETWNAQKNKKADSFLVCVLFPSNFFGVSLENKLVLDGGIGRLCTIPILGRDDPERFSDTPPL